MSEALSVIAKARSADAVRAALETLPEGDAALRQAILDRYARLAANPKRSDADGGIRTALVRGLRSCALPADRPLLEAATRTYEYSYSGETAFNLRAAALLTLSRVDDGAAGFQAVRLLREATPGTGEPALTAARLLAVLGQQLPLYAHLLGEGAEGEVAAECFRGLATAPDAVLLDLVERWHDSQDEIALLGLLDALLDRPAPGPLEEVLRELLRDSPHLDLVRYLAAALVSRRWEPLIEAMREGPWPSPARREIMTAALELLG